MSNLEGIALLGASILLTATVSLATAGAQQSTTELKDAKQRLATKASGEKGYPKQLLQMEQLRLGDLIDDLEAGKHVDAQQIDRALDHANELGR